MNIVVLGDFHSKFEAAQRHLESIFQVHGIPELVVQVGDFGFFPQLLDIVWTMNNGPLLHFVCGNHEDHWTLRAMMRGSEDWGIVDGPSENWRKAMDSWTYMPRGSIQNGILYVGGARSINIRHAIRGVDWFPEENISHEEQQQVFDAIAEYGPKNIHTVITHDAPAIFDVSEGCTQTGREIIDANRKFLDAVRQEVRPKRWYFGHYHHKMEGVVDGTYFRCVDMIRDGADDNDYVFETFDEVR